MATAIGQGDMNIVEQSMDEQTSKLPSEVGVVSGYGQNKFEGDVV